MKTLTMNGESIGLGRGDLIEISGERYKVVQVADETSVTIKSCSQILREQLAVAFAVFCVVAAGLYLWSWYQGWIH